ncbi:hypothetical protein ACHHYP_02498 [Achlya hypogyna]|uniref:VWFA domain-containing protein n=1 Tax=Achlya hypogyna TaxID=1202772 RepID=A0A1V9Z687_ACHHY|nr:hypothetical protein ACHHYP_02498 [Achlya hypogyna]
MTPQRTKDLAAFLESAMRASSGLSTLRASPNPYQAIVHDYYLPIFAWAEAQLDRLNPPTAESKKCLVLGLSCVQGGGKTTMTSYLEQLFGFTGKRCAVLSIDDVYYTRDEQLSIAQNHPGNPLLEFRGNPGTQDIDLLLDIIKQAKLGKDVLVPRYDKSAFQGRGDRAPQDRWSRHAGPLDVLLIEGWCLGFQASTRPLSNPHLVPVNDALRAFDRVYEELAATIVVQVESQRCVYTWREEAEADMRAQGKSAMTPAQIRDFVDRFMPAYDAYLTDFYTAMARGGPGILATKPRLLAPTNSMVLGVAASYESLNCYHLLQMAVEADDGSLVFQPTLIESELFRLLRALGWLDETKGTTPEEQFGRAVNANGTGGVDVVGCFGKQTPVAAELRARGWWPAKLEKHLSTDHEGVYAVVIAEVCVRPKLVLFTWLRDSSFGPDLLRERATYALRFVTTLTPTVVCCLDATDWTALELAAAETRGATAWKKYSVAFSITEAQVEAEKVTATVQRVMKLASAGQALAPSTGSMPVAQRVYTDTNVVTKLSSVAFPTPEAFATWLVATAATHRIQLQAPIPRPSMKAALLAWDAFPQYLVDEVTMQSLEDQCRADLAATVALELQAMEARCLHNAAILFYVSEEWSAAFEKQANEEMNRDFAMMKNWIGSTKLPRELHISPRINNSINAEYNKCLHEGVFAKQDKGYLDSLVKGVKGLIGVPVYTPLSFPYMTKHAVEMAIVVPRINAYLLSQHQDWCHTLKRFLRDPVVGTAMINRKFYQDRQAKDFDAMLRNSKEAIVYDAFVTKIGALNSHHPEALVTTVEKVSAGHVWYGMEHIQGGATMVQLSPLEADPPAKLKLPLHAVVVYLGVVGSSVVVVFTTPDDKTHVQAMQMHGKRPMTLLVQKVFPHVVYRVDFDATHRMLALLHSATHVDMYAFNESYKVLERVHQFNLLLLRVVAPYSQLVLFGGDNHGIFAADADGAAQAYYIRSKQLSKLVPMCLSSPATKLVKMHGGAFLVLLDIAADNLRLRLQTLTTGDMTPLPEAEVDLPAAFNWPATTAMAYDNSVALLDSTTAFMVVINVSIATGKVAWQLQCAQQAAPATAGEAHVLWALFHLYEKFPVRALMYAKSTSVLLPAPLRLHVCTPTSSCRNVMTTVLNAVMTKLAAQHKDLSHLSLATDAVLAPVRAELAWPSMPLAAWVLELVGFVPVPICRANDNQLVLLHHGLPATYVGTEAHVIAPQISFGPVSHVLRHWTGPVVVLTSMGKQSTGKSYFLNHLTGSSFAMSGARCTDGVWLTARRLDTTLVVVLDFEGLGSFERSAQEDTFLSVLNAAVSRLTVFRIEMRFDKDIDGMFAKFQQGVSLLKGDARLFRGKLYLNAKDVNPNDQGAVVAEFSSKLQTVLHDNRRDNFVSTMYGGDVVITCCPPLGNKGYYEALTEAAGLLHAAAATKPYKDGGDFHDCLAMVLAKISLLDWTCMEDNVKEQRARVSRQQLRTALRYGAIDGASLGLDEDSTMAAQFQTLVAAKMDEADADYADVPPDGALDLGVDLHETDEAASLATAKAVLLDYLAKYLEHVDEPRSTSHEARFDALWAFVVWRREYRVRRWFSSLGVVGRDELDDLDACVGKTKQLLRRCTHVCSECKLGCFASFLHEASVPHDCGTNHKCQGVCDHCDANAAPCGLAAGHMGACNCCLVRHTCPEPCALAGASNCDGGCHGAVDHDGPHACSVALHCCGAPCAAAKCRGLCTLPFAMPHSEHTCGANRCHVLCIHKDCTNTCAVEDHFHAPVDDVHVCGNEHRCTVECAAAGMCEVKVQLEKTTETFCGARGTFEYTRQEMNGGRKKCAVPVAAGCVDHAGTGHACDTAMHWCTARCPCCQYYCEKAEGHTDLHKTSHGNMKETYFVSDSAHVDVGGRQYAAGERGVAEMCPFFCSKMGRGHVHYVPCEHESPAACVYATSDGRRHCTIALEPHPRQPMDEVLHATYWKMQGWEDPVTSTVERQTFGLCPYQCDAPEHKDTMSHCILEAWHVPATATTLSGQTIVHGHLFDCKHFASRGVAHHVFVLDASGSMCGKPWDDLNAAVDTYLADQLAGKGNDCRDIVSIVTFSCRGKIVLEGRRMRDAATASIPYQGGSTNFDAGLRCAVEVLSRNDHVKYAPVLLFFSDGYPNSSASGLYLADHIAANFGRYNLLSFLVGFGNMNFVCLEQLAVRMHGTFHNAISGVDLLDTFKKISVSVHLKSGLVCGTGTKRSL